MSDILCFAKSDIALSVAIDPLDQQRIGFGVLLGISLVQIIVILLDDQPVFIILLNDAVYCDSMIPYALPFNHKIAILGTQIFDFVYIRVLLHYHGKISLVAYKPYVFVKDILESDVKPGIVVNVHAHLRAKPRHFAKLFDADTDGFGQKSEPFLIPFLKAVLYTVKRIILIDVDIDVFISDPVHDRVFASEPHGNIQCNRIKIPLRVAYRSADET